ncbi:MAG: hypothetical protein IT297_10720 [Anaerolineae bacterium]|jgi:hypothetical protein|nr:hypothetical protein [Anaerolineae bacterium]MCZ7553697.1 hypothetical protein [Anaerolineales bacterium]
MAEEKDLPTPTSSAEPPPENDSSAQVDPLVRILLNMLADTHADELPCDEVFELIDHYAELDLDGEDAARIYPLIRLHLERCRDCQEEYQALLRALQAA